MKAGIVIELETGRSERPRTRVIVLATFRTNSRVNFLREFGRCT